MLRAFHAEALVRPLLRMARYSNSTMQSAAFLALGNLMSYPAAQQCLCEVIHWMRPAAMSLPKHSTPAPLQDVMRASRPAGSIFYLEASNGSIEHLPD